MRLVNRRFVPLYFDLNPGGALADNKARAFVVKAKPDLGGSAVSTPPVLVMTPQGEVLGEVDNYATEEVVLDSLRDVLGRHSGWNQPSEEEKRISKSGSPLERAYLLLDLGHDDAARRLLEKEASPAAAALLAHVCRIAKNWDAMERALARATDAELADDARVERAWRHLAERDLAAALAQLSAFPKESARYTEARYVEGLARWHEGRKELALEIWKSTIESCSQDPWIYRADWAFTQAKEGGERRVFSTGDERRSPLGRIGYMGRRNPDLEPPP
jgi:hypothetical protein